MRDKIQSVKKLGDILTEQGLLNQDQLSEALDIQRLQGGLLGEILVQLKYITEDAVAFALSAMHDKPTLSLENYQMDPDILKILPIDVVRKYQAVPIERFDSVLSVVVSSPLGEKEREILQGHSGCQVQEFISTMSDIRKSIKKHYESDGKSSRTGIT
jgi:type IV pilus assembly protein PilB